MLDEAENGKHIVEIIDYSNDGDGIAKLDDGCVVFVKGAVRGDICRIIITKTLSHSCHAEIDELLSSSEHRIDVDCPVFDKCGGCHYRHISYSEELDAKRKKVNDALRRIGGLEIEIEDIFSAGSINGYRNKAQFPVSYKNNQAILGYYRPMSHEVIGIDECLTVNNAVNNAIRCVKKWLCRYDISVYNEKTATGLIRHIYTRTGSGGLMVCLVINGSEIPRRHELIDMLRQECDSFSDLLLNINRSRGNIILGENFITLWGNNYVEDSLGDLCFRMSPSSFFQVNSEGALLLYNKVNEYAALTKDDFVIDLFCGTGTIALFLANGAKKVLGVDCVPSSIKNAKENALLNNIENAEFIEADVSSLNTDDLNPNCIVVDPPRKGLSEETIQKIEVMSPSRIIYVSCDPATLSRDIKRLRGYEAVRACAVNMFPRTKHVECVVLMSRTM